MHSVPANRFRRNLVAIVLSAITVAVVATFAGFAPQASAAQPLIGTQTHTTWGSYSDSAMRKELDLLVGSGSNLIRADMNWSSLETEGKGQISPWYRQKWDTLLAEAEQRGIKVIATVFGTPCWASSAPSNLKQNCAGEWWDRGVTAYPPADNDDFGDAVAWMANRWGHRLAGMEIWNGPNLPEQRFLVANNLPQKYTQMLKAAYPRAKAASPSLNVIGGVIEWSDVEFLEKMYQYGAKGYFDSLAVHPYNEWRHPDDLWKEEWTKFSFRRGVPAMYDVLVRNGEGHKKLWLTEYGWSTCSDGDRWCVSRSEQADFIADSLRIVRGWDFVAGATIYQLRDAGSGNCRECQFGMFERDWTPKPAWKAYKKAVAGMYPVRVKIKGARNLKVDSSGVAKGLVIVCRGQKGAKCTGSLKVRKSGKLIGKGKVNVKAGKKKQVRIRLRPAGLKAAKQSRRITGVKVVGKWRSGAPSTRSINLVAA